MGPEIQIFKTPDSTLTVYYPHTQQTALSLGQPLTTSCFRSTCLCLTKAPGNPRSCNQRGGPLEDSSSFRPTNSNNSLVCSLSAYQGHQQAQYSESSSASSETMRPGMGYPHVLREPHCEVWNSNLCSKVEGGLACVSATRPLSPWWGPSHVGEVH